MSRALEYAVIALIVAAAFLVIAMVVAQIAGELDDDADAEEPPAPHEIWGHWWTCDGDYMIFRGRCYPMHRIEDGPVVEYAGDPYQPNLGNVGSPGGFGAGASTAGPAFGGFSAVIVNTGRVR